MRASERARNAEEGLPMEEVVSPSATVSSSSSSATKTTTTTKDDDVNALKNACLVFFVNSRSGSRASLTLCDRIKRRYQTHKDCEVIFLDDYRGNQEVLRERVRYEAYRRHKNNAAVRARAVACGGDGTVSWTFSLLKTACEEEEREFGVSAGYCVPVGQLPLGTGNEFARVFGWNESKDRWENDFDAFCEEMKRGEIATADLWKFVSESVVDLPKSGESENNGKTKKTKMLKEYFSSSSSKSSLLRQRSAAPTTTRGEEQKEKEEEKRRRRRRNWSFSGHLRSPSELEETLVESIRDHDSTQTTPHPSLPASLFADPPLSPPGATTQMDLVQKRREFVPPKLIVEETIKATTTKTTTTTINPFVSLPPGEHVRNDSIASSTSYMSAIEGVVDEEKIEYDGAKDIEAGGAKTSPPLVKVEKFEKLSACFFSVGFDAGIALQFHQFREKTEKCCVVPKTVSANVAGYGVLGALEWLAKRRYLTPKTILLYVDNKQIPIPERANTIQIFNIHSSTTGVDFFGSGEKSKPHEHLQDFQPPSVQDGLVEVVATYGVGHLSAIRFRMTHSHRLAQGKKVEIVLKRPLPVQVDGEPWLNPPGRLKFTFSRSWPVVLGLGELRNVCPSPPPPPPPSKSASPSSSSPSSKHRGNHLDDEKQSKTAAAKRVIAPPPFGDEMV